MNANAQAYRPKACCFLNADAPVFKVSCPGIFYQERYRAPNIARSFPVFPSLNPQPSVCRYFIKGSCRKGLNCPFLHSQDSRSTGTGHGSAASVEHGNDAFIGKASSSQFVNVGDGIRCLFGPGLTVETLQLGSEEKSSVVISGLPPLVTDHDVEARLSPFGELLSLSIRDSADKASKYSTATFSHVEQARNAALSLHGSSAESWIGTASIYRPGASKSMPHKSVF